MNKKSRLQKAFTFLQNSGTARTQKIAAEAMGTTPPNFSSALKGDEKVLTDSFIKRFCEAFPAISASWLLTGVGDMLVDEDPDRPAVIPPGKVPVVNLDVRGGFACPDEMSGQQVERLVSWDGSRRGDLAAPVTGMSMAPHILPGSLVLLRPVDGWRVFIEYHQIYVIVLNDGRRLLKQVKPSDTPGHITLHSYNPDYHDQELPLDFVNNILKVVGVMTTLGF